jgi:pyruvate dehydrogenase E2 component (dihydrolipoamide acetyltransferase)
MSKIEFKLPDIGEGVTEGEIVSWLVKEGDVVAEDQDMVEVMTDKATVTIGAPAAGKVAEVRAQQGDTVPVGQVIVVLDGDAEGAATADAGEEDLAEAAPQPSAASQPGVTPVAVATQPAVETSASAVGDIKEQLPGMQEAPASASAGDHFNEKPLAAPVTRKLARELGVDLRRVPPSGSAGRVTKEDVQAFANRGGAPATTSTSTSTQTTAAPVPPVAVPKSELEERIPIRGVRKRMFESMARSKRTAAHFTYVDECECSALIALRSRVRPLAEKRGVKLTFLPFIVKAVVAALRKHPGMNCLVDEASSEIVLRKNYDIGIAVATDTGLIVPVLRGADRLSILDVAREIDRLAETARSGKVAREDLGGSSFTITSLGKVGGLLATPVVNLPEVGILYVPQMKKRPVVIDDEIRVGNVMDLSLSFDHRVVDGHLGATFTQEVIEMLSNPDELMLEL